MPNAIVSAYRRRFPTDARSDDELTVAIGQAYPEYSDPEKFPDFHSDLQRVTRAGQPQPNASLEITPFPPSAGDYARQALGSGIRGITSTLGSIPRAFGSAARIAGTYSVPGAEDVPMYVDTQPGFVEQAIPRLGEAISPEPVPGLEKSFLATTLPSNVGSGIGFIAGGAAAGAAEMGIVRRIGAAVGERALERGIAAGLTEEAAHAAAVTEAQAAIKSAATRLSYGNIASLGALSQAQQGYDEAQRAGADGHTRFLAFALNLPVGLTEAVPLASMLNKMDKLSGGALKHSLVDVAKEAGINAFEEALQNSFQGVAGDVIAAKIAKYEPDRKIFSSLAEDAAGGGISAAILSLATSAIGAKMHGRPTTAAVVPPAPSAADVSAQYASEQQKAADHAQKLLETARRNIAGPWTPEDGNFVASLRKSDQAIYAGLLDQARKEKDAADQRIEQQRSLIEHQGTPGIVPAEGEDRGVAAEVGTGGAGAGDSNFAAQGGAQPVLVADQPVVAPEKGIVPPAAPPVAPVVFHSAVVLPGLPPLVYYTPTAEIRGAEGGLYKPGHAITPQNLAGFTIPPSEVAKANSDAMKQGAVMLPSGALVGGPTAAGGVIPNTPAAPTPAPAATVTVIPPVLEAIAQKVASPTGSLTADEIATLPKSTDALYAAFHQRVAELKGTPPAPVQTATPPVIRPSVTLPPVVPPVVATKFSKARAKALAIATTVKQKVAAVIHASPILDTIDFEGDAPLSFELSGRGVGDRTKLPSIGKEQVILGAGKYEGYSGTLVKEGEAGTGVPAEIRLKNGDVIQVQESEYKSVKDVLKEMREGTGKGGKQVALAPVFFEIAEAPAANDTAIREAGLISRAPITAKKVDHGSRNSWTHRWTIFRGSGDDANRIYFLPTYKAEGKIFAMEAGKNKGTPVVSLMKRGYTPIASFRAEKAVHAKEAAKPVLGADEYERTFASHARERMAALARTYSRVAESMEPTQAVTTETIDVRGVQTELPSGQGETLTGGEAEGTVQAVLPTEVSFSDELANDLYPTLTKVLAGTTGKLNLSQDATIQVIVKYAKKGKYGEEIRTELAGLRTDIGEAKASRAILDHIVRSYNNSRTSAEFAEALSGRRGRPIKSAVAPAGQRGLPGAHGDRGARPGQPAAAVPAPTGNAPVSEPTPTKPKAFVPSNTGYSTAAGVTAKLNDLLDTLAVAGADVSVVQGQLVMLGETQELLGAQLGNRIVLAMADVTKPASENLIAAIHETIHWLAERESPEMQERLHRAVDALSDVQLGLPPDIADRLSDPRIDPEVRAAERLAYALQGQGVDAIAARGLAQRIIRALKDLWYRATMAIQEAFMGPGSANPERVVEYFKNRLNSFLAGDQTPLSFIHFLGGPKPSLYRQAQFYTPVWDGSNVPSVVFDWANASVNHSFYVPDTVDAARFNVINAVRDGWKFMEMEPVFAGEKIGGDSPTVRAAGTEVSAKETQGMLERAYIAFGANAATTPFSEFVGLLKEGADLDLPADIIAGDHAALDAIGAPHPNPDLSINGPVAFTNDASKQQTRAMSLMVAKAWFANANRMFWDATSKISRLAKESARKIDRHEKLALKFADLTTALDASKEVFRELIKETKADIGAFIRDAKLIGMLTQSLKEFQVNVNDPVPAHYEAVIDKMAKRLFDDAEHFTEFLQDAAALDVNWHSQTMPQIKDELSTLLSANPLFAGLTDEQSNVALSLVAAFARSNDHHMAWLAVRASNDHEARDAIRDMLAEARKGTTESLNKAKAMVNSVPRKAAQAQRILTAYTQALKDSQSVIQEQFRNNKILLIHAAAAPVFQQAINDLERPLTARKLAPTSVVDGAELPYVASATSTLEEIESAEPWIAHLSGELQRTPAETQAMAQRYDAWVLAHESTGGAMVETLRDLSKQLKLIDASKQTVAIKQSWLARVVGTMGDTMLGTGTLAGTRADQRMRNQSRLEGQHLDGPHGLRTYGTRVEALKSRAMTALGIKNNQTFDTLIHQAGKGYLEKRKDLQERPDAREAALGALHAFYLSNPAVRPLFKPGVWDKVRAYFEANVEYNDRAAKINKVMGNRVHDENLGLYRDVIGDPVFAWPRGIKGTFESFFHKFKDQWNGTKRDRLKAPDIAQKFTDDPAALATSLAPMFSKDVWEKWVGPWTNRQGRSAFSGRMYAPGKWTIASVDNVARAYREASAVPGPGERALTFAMRLHELEGGTPDTLALHVGETLETLQNYFDGVEKIFGQTSDDRFGLNTGVPRFLMDARISEEMPTEFLEYQRFDQNHARSAVHRMAFHAAYGRNGEAIVAEFEAAKAELNAGIESWTEYQNKAGAQHPLAHGKELLRLARELAAADGKTKKDIALMENARSNLVVVNATEGHFEGWNRLPAQDVTEAKVFLNMLSVISSLMVQGPKTAMINTVDLTGGPFVQFGISTQAIRMVKDDWAYFANTAFGTLFNTIGISFQRNSEDMLRLTRLGYGDQDNSVARRDKVLAESSAELPGDHPIGNALVRGLRTFRTATQIGIPQAGGLFPTIKAAPFSLISSWMNLAMIRSHWNMGRGMVGRAVEYYRSNPAMISDPYFRFSADDLGYKKGILLDDEAGFKAQVAAMARYGISLEEAAKDALKPGAPLLTDEHYTGLAEMALEEMSLEASPNTAPRWAHQSAARFAMPLLRWSFARTDQLRKSFNEPNGEKSLRAFTSGMKVFALITGVGLGMALLMDLYDDKVTGKKSNIRGFGQQNNLLAAVERTARIGSWGLWGDVTNTVGNLAESGDLRGLSFDGRVVFANSLINMMNSVTTLARQGTADYASVYRQMLGAIGGSGYLQVAQIVNNAFSLDNAEARVTSRINVSNWLRAVGREMGLDVRTSRGVGSYSLPTKESAYIGQMILAAMADDSGDFIRAYSQAVTAAREDGKPDPAKYVQQSYAARNPLRTVYVTPPTEAEFHQILSRLPASGRSDVQTALMLLAKYGNFIGAPEYFGKVESSKPPPLFAPRQANPAQIRGSVSRNLFPVYR